MNCKPGDLAIIVKAPLSKDGDPIGMIVEVTDEWTICSTYGHCWLCDFPRGINTVGAGVLRRAHLADDWIRPVSGLPITDDIKDEVNV